MAYLPENAAFHPALTGLEQTRHYLALRGEDQSQAVDRVHRIGQKSTVFVYRMVTAGTIEERIQALKASKKDLFDKLIGGLGGDFDLSQHFTSLKSLVTLTAHAEPEMEPEPYTID